MYTTGVYSIFVEWITVLVFVVGYDICFHEQIKKFWRFSIRFYQHNDCDS